MPECLFSVQVFLHCGSFSSAIDLNPSPRVAANRVSSPALGKKNGRIFAENSTSSRSNISHSAAHLKIDTSLWRLNR